MDLTYEKVKQTILRLYGKWWEDPYDLNVFGLRNPNHKPDSFDDIMGVAWTDLKGNKNIVTFNGTTVPGIYWLNFPMNVKGTGILAKGYYPALWKRNPKKTGHAFIQVGKCVAIRDNNKDSNADVNAKVRETGLFGCDFHKANEGRETKIIGKWSAMCQVPAHSKYVDQVVSLMLLQEKYVKCDTLSYALIGMEDIK